MKPLFTKTIRNRSIPSNSTPTYGSHQMMPLSDNDKDRVPNFRDRAVDPTCSTNTTVKYGSGTSNEYMMSKDGVGYERDFTIEEQYLADLPQPLPKIYQ